MQLPADMKYVAVGEGTGPEILHTATGPVPRPGPGDVLIRVLVAGVNRPDIAQRRGQYPPPPGASPILGLEVAGEVVGLGGETGDWRVGDHVCALVNGGGYAEYCVAPATQCLRWPTGYDAVRAAALPENYFTVWANLFDRGLLRSGEAALVHGGTSGIGLTAIQLADEFGSPIYATAGSAEKCAACRRYGATEAINYREADFREEIKRLTAGRGVDVVLDMVGAPYLARNIASLAKDGRLVLIAFMHGSKVENLDMLAVMTKRLTITGSTMRPRTRAEKGAIADALHAKVWPVLAAGRCGPVIDTVFPMAEAGSAHALMESGSHVGKIMLDVAGVGA